MQSNVWSPCSFVPRLLWEVKSLDTKLGYLDGAGLAINHLNLRVKVYFEWVSYMY